MTFYLELPNDLTRELEEEAARAGLPLAEYALRILSASVLSTQADSPPRTGAELVAYWKREGLLGSRPEVEDPVAYARELRERAQRRIRT